VIHLICARLFDLTPMLASVSRRDGAEATMPGDLATTYGGAIRIQAREFR
jgi:hypothetical protein